MQQILSFIFCHYIMWKEPFREINFINLDLQGHEEEKRDVGTLA